MPKKAGRPKKADLEIFKDKTPAQIKEMYVKLLL